MTSPQSTLEIAVFSTPMLINIATVGPLYAFNTTNNVDTAAVADGRLLYKEQAKIGSSYDSTANFNIGRYSQAGPAATRS